MSIAELARWIRAGKVSPRDAVQSYLDRIEQLDGELNAFISVDTVEGSTGPVIRIRPPALNSISMTPAFAGDGGSGSTAPGSGAIAIGLNVAGICARSQSCCRHRNNWLA